ncbi:hypothetical protein NBO_8g0003 [Nosema bombycis CQ1]|uniref:Uncharacterized protein n=1 Tax=Nosema bombycis (strain CQ1 / CVCC 102059) TaxID=578461 RepID=R0MQH1_NOSB1|nr:hypothetical protein NBO_8g0003 [Nosema bombycis CQ1]|eukprot:EOB15138.1 hypothetical protein NBO_8g0003 [Nosema bombycis CQ1]
MKSYTNIFNKYERTYMVCCIFLVWQFVINIYELSWLITVNFEENVIKSHLENDKYTLSLFKKSNEVGIIFAISTVIVSFCSICIYNGAYYISKRKKNSRSFIYNEIYSIIFHTTINTMMSFTMKPI